MNRQIVGALAICGLLGCSKPAENNPMSNARSNLVDTYTLSNGSMVDLARYDCSPPMRKGKDGVGYVECYAVLKGFAHAEVQFCSTAKDGDCGTSRPQE